MDAQIKSPASMIMLVWDDSASMHAEFMTNEIDGLFDGKKYLFPDDGYAPSPDYVVGIDGALDAAQRAMWRSRWSGYNHIYYDPRRNYNPWPSTRNYDFGLADLQRPLSDPTRTGAADARFLLSGISFNASLDGKALSIPHAHYFILNDIDGNGRKDEGEHFYLVAWQDADGDGRLDLGNSASDDRRIYFRIEDGDSGRIGYELHPVLDAKEKNVLKPIGIDPVTKSAYRLTDKEELQNFANWFSYHRRREFVGKAAAAELIIGLPHGYVGIYALNRTPRIGVRAVHMEETTGETGEANRAVSVRESLLDALYAAKSEGKTAALRYGLDQVGRYFDQDNESRLGRFPFQSAGQGGGCQNAHAVIISDGFWNESYTGVGNADGDQGVPYADAWHDTLADVAMHYYKKDLSGDLSDLVPIGPCDQRRHQRMRTHTFSFGLTGTVRPAYFDNIAPRADLCAAITNPSLPAWPRPQAGQPAMVDDLLHAAVNGRGISFRIDDIAYLIDELIASGSEERWIASSGPVSDNPLLDNGTIVYQARYLPGDWIGEVTAYMYDQKNDEIDTRPEKAIWRASDYLLPTPYAYDERRIVTFGGSQREPPGVPFRYGDLSEGQKRALGSDLNGDSVSDRKASELLDYIRGREQPHYRKRSSLLGDIVHSAPVLSGNTLFVGANDGMLHAFDATTGRERFAYVPNRLFDQLKMLGRPEYARRHRFYVDATLSVGTVWEGHYRRRTYLIGGLGKGGKGYFCLCLQDRHRSGEDGQGSYETDFDIDHVNASTLEQEVARAVMWEYPTCQEQNCSKEESDRDIGFSFGQGYVVNGNAPGGTHRSIVVFGNGYGSASGKAVLYILDAASGKLIRKIDTGAGDDNGLSVPALVDVDLDRRVDYVYAGDLKGNLWKFDLTAVNPHQWGVAYGEDLNCNGVIDAREGDFPQPVFQAGKHQPITGRPDVMSMAAACAPGAPGYMVIFGTGKFLGKTDLDDTRQQSVYAIWDYGDDSDNTEYLGQFLNRSQGLLSSGLHLAHRHIVAPSLYDDGASFALSDSTCDYATTSDNEDADGVVANNRNRIMADNPARCAGWFFDFPSPPEPHAHPGERVTGKVTIRNGQAMVISFAPNSEPCSSGSNSWGYRLNVCGKDALTNGVNASVRFRQYEGLLSEPVTILKKSVVSGKDVVLGSDKHGRISMMEIPGEKWGKVFWQHNLAD